MPYSLLQVDRQVGGQRLTRDVMQSMEGSCQAHLALLEGSPKVISSRLREMERFLEVSKENLDSVRKQNWFKRVWKTVTGGNRNLERTTQANLLQVQKGALFFLEQMLEREEFLSQKVGFSLERLEQLQIDNGKVRAFIAELSRRVSVRLDQIQHDEQVLRSRVDDHDAQLSDHAEVIEKLGGKLRKPLNLARPPRAALELAKPDRVENRQLAEELRKSTVRLLQLQVTQRIEITPFMPFVDSLSKWHAATADLRVKDADLPKNVIRHLIAKSLEVKPSTPSSSKGALKGAIADFGACWEELLAGIRTNYLRNSIGLEAEIPFAPEEREELRNELFGLLRSHHTNLQELGSMREDLVRMYPEFRKISERSAAAGNAKAIIEGLTLGLPSVFGVPTIEKEDEIQNEFVRAYGLYSSKWESSRTVLKDAVLPAHRLAWREAVHKMVAKLSLVVDAFDSQGLSLKPLIKDLDNAVDELRASQERESDGQ